jgi:hypothetical protein
MVNEEFDIDSDDETDLEIERETVSKESSNEKSESKNETSGASVDGWNEVTLGNQKPKIFTFTKNAGPKFNLLPAAGPMDFGSFFNDELLNNTVIETNRYDRDKIMELHLSPWSTWNMWCDVSSQNEGELLLKIESSNRRSAQPKKEVTLENSRQRD